MKRYLLAVILLLTTEFIFSQMTTPYLSENVKTISTESLFSSSLPDDEFDLTAFTINAEGQFIFVNASNDQIVQLSNDFEILNQYNSDIAVNIRRIECLDDNKILLEADKYLQLVTLSGETIFRVDMNSHNLHYLILNQLLYIENHIVIPINGGAFWSIKNPGTNIYINRSRISGTADTKEQILNGTFSNKNVEIINNRYFKVDQQLLSRNYDNFRNYWREEHDKIATPMPENYYNSLFTSSNFEYLGIDQHENIYWYSKEFILMYDKNGWLINFLSIDGIEHNILPAIHTNGDIYFINFNEDEVRLSILDKLWSTEDIGKQEMNEYYHNLSGDAFNNNIRGKYVFLNTDNVSLQSEPDSASSTIEKLTLKNRLQILDRSNEKEYWYKVKTDWDQEGWIYGSYLNLCEASNRFEYDDYYNTYGDFYLSSIEIANQGYIQSHNYQPYLNTMIRVEDNILYSQRTDYRISNILSGVVKSGRGANLFEDGGNGRGVKANIYCTDNNIQIIIEGYYAGFDYSYVIEYRKDYSGDPEIVIGPNYDYVNYGINREPIPIFSSPSFDAPIIDQIPVWHTQDFSCYAENGIDEENMEGLKSFYDQINRNEIEVFTLLQSNLSSDSFIGDNRIWAKVLYKDIEGYCIIDFRKLSSAERYWDNLYYKIFPEDFDDGGF